MNAKIADLNFPKTLNYHQWELYLRRRLTHAEHELLCDYKSEKHINQILDSLCLIADKKGLYVSNLTQCDGNCLFESLVHHGLTDSIETIKNVVSNVMYLFQDYPNFFPNQKETLKELFDTTNEIEYVYCHTDKKYYKYTYTLMCQDILNNSSWARMPTELIFMVLSFLYDIEFTIIVNTSDWEGVVNAYEGTQKSLNKIYMGKLKEYHYVTLKTKDEKEYPLLKYMDAKKKFFDWAIEMWNYVNELEDTDSGDDYYDKLIRYIPNDKYAIE